MKKRTLTILELFFCIAILSLVGSFLIFKSQPMITHYRFEGSVHRLAKELEWSHKVAMSTSGEIDFIINKKGTTLFCHRMTDEPFSFKGGNHRFKIPHISHFLFNNKEINELKITFTRSGWIIPKGKLQLINLGKQFEISLNPNEHQSIQAKRSNETPHAIHLSCLSCHQLR